MNLRSVFMAAMLSLQGLNPVGSALADGVPPVFMGDEMGKCTIKTSRDGERFESKLQGHITYYACEKQFNDAVSMLEQSGQAQLDQLPETSNLAEYRERVLRAATDPEGGEGIVMMIFTGSAIGISTGNDDIVGKVLVACNIRYIGMQLSLRRKKILLEGCSPSRND